MVGHDELVLVTGSVVSTLVPSFDDSTAPLGSSLDTFANAVVPVDFTAFTTEGFDLLDDVCCWFVFCCTLGTNFPVDFPALGVAADVFAFVTADPVDVLSLVLDCKRLTGFLAGAVVAELDELVLSVDFDSVPTVLSDTGPVVAVVAPLPEGFFSFADDGCCFFGFIMKTLGATFSRLCEDDALLRASFEETEEVGKHVEQAK